MDDATLAAIKARASAATPGPWMYDAAIGYVDSMYLPRLGAIAGYVAVTNGPFIASARADVPALVAEVERLGAENDVLYVRLQAIADVSWDNLEDTLIELRRFLEAGE